MSVDWKQIFSGRYHNSSKPYYAKCGYGNELSLKIRKDKIKKIVERYYTSGLCVDIGCGLGAYCEVLPTNYIGIDFIIEPILTLKRSSGRKVVLGDVMKLPLRDEISNLCVAIEVTQHLDNLELFFYEVSRITKQDGIFVLISPNPESLLWFLRGKIKGKSPLNFITISSSVKILQKFNFTPIVLDGVFLPLFPIDYLGKYLSIGKIYNFTRYFAKSYVLVCRKG